MAAHTEEMQTLPVKENVKKVEELVSQVQAHCMCAVFEDLGGAYRVLYAPGFQVDGVQAVYARCGKALALQRILDAMERHWLQDYPFRRS
jgi:hypothetical protein